MSNDKIAVDKRTALRMFWNAGISGLPTEQGEIALLKANDVLNTLYQPTPYYFLADDVSKEIDKFLKK